MAQTALTSIDNTARPVDLIYDSRGKQSEVGLAAHAVYGKGARASAGTHGQIKELAFDSSNSVVGVQKKINPSFRKRSVDQV